MTRTEVLRDLLDNGRDCDTPRLEAIAAELGLPVADVLVVAGHPVPGHLLPPDRDKNVMRTFAYRVTYCNHPQLAVGLTPDRRLTGSVDQVTGGAEAGEAATGAGVVTIRVAQES